MGLSNSFTRHIRGILSWVMGGSSEPQVCLTAPAGSEGDHASASRLPHASAGRGSRVESAESKTCSSVEQHIQQSMRHWSQLTEPDCISPEEQVAVEIENRAVFQELESHSQWGQFFKTFGYSFGIWASCGELEVGSKFAEGGQAELFHAHVTWKNPMLKEQDLRTGDKYVLKVFKKGTSLCQLQSQWPEGMFQKHAKIMELTELGRPQTFRFDCEIWCGTLLKDGRFAFLMVKEDEDLRSTIDRNMLINDLGSAPFSAEESERIMYHIAFGMKQLHSLNIVHRDLKASNVLITKHEKGNYKCYIADYECSIGVVGTGFFRAPEVLQALKYKNMRPDIFTKEVDVYSYGMTCYEILTGKLPFEGHPTNDYDLVLNGQRPELPEYVSDWMCDLLKKCWQSDPRARPTFGDILEFLMAKSARISDLDEKYKKREESRLAKFRENRCSGEMWKH